MILIIYLTASIITGFTVKKLQKKILYSLVETTVPLSATNTFSDNTDAGHYLICIEGYGGSYLLTDNDKLNVKSLVSTYYTGPNSFVSNNLADSALAMLREKYEGTTLGRQELYAEIIENLEGALWTSSLIDEARLPEDTEKELKQIIVAIDPAVTNNEDSDETGIVVVGKDHNNEYYVLEDATGKYSPDAWAKKAINCYYDWDADRIVAETNNGGDLVERLLRGMDLNIPYRSVRATRGKLIRAEPIAALYEQRRVHHIGYFPELESQMCSYIGETRPSPDRLDALVWGITELSRSKGDVNWRIS